jgi:hypothetical protein
MYVPIITYIGNRLPATGKFLIITESLPITEYFHIIYTQKIGFDNASKTSTLYHHNMWGGNCAYVALSMPLSVTAVMRFVFYFAGNSSISLSIKTVLPCKFTQTFICTDNSYTITTLRME